MGELLSYNYYRYLSLDKLTSNFGYRGKVPSLHWINNIICMYVDLGNIQDQQQQQSKYQPCGAGGTRSLPAMLHCLQYLTACLIQNGLQSLEISQTLSLNKIVDPINPSVGVYP